MTQIHIAFVITRADAIGGATVHVRDLAQAMLRSGHRATVLVGGTGVVTEELTRARVPFISLRRMQRSVNPLRDVMAVRELGRALRGIAPDLVSAHTAKAGCIARLACAGTKVPCLYTPHGWAISDRISRAHGMVYRQVERRLAGLSAAIVNVCEYERRLALKLRVGHPDRHRVVYNGMPDIPAELRADPRRQPPRILMVARFEEPKDHLTLVEALAGLQHLPWTLEFAGEGPLEDGVKQRVESLGMAKRVRFLGTVESAAAPLATAQIFALSSRSEAFPRSILEAMRAGLPVVASNTGGIAEAVEDGRNGYVVERESAAAMRDALERLIRDPFRRAGFGAASRQDYERRFGFGRMLAETLSIYEQVTGAAGLADAAQRRQGWLPLPR